MRARLVSLDYLQGIFVIDLLLYILTGVLAGTLSGIFGIGGGTIVVPALVLIFGGFQFLPTDFPMHAAIGTSLAVMVVTTASAVMSHQRYGSILWGVLRSMLPGMVVGSACGAIVAHWLASADLKIGFGVFMLIIALRMLFTKSMQNDGEAQLPGRLVLFVFAIFVGLLSVLLGIGAGALTVPFFIRCHMKMNNAAGTASACSLLAATLGTVGFVLTGWGGDIHVLNWSTGYIYWPAFAGVALGGLVFAPIGAKLSHKLPTQVLRPVFAVLLLVVGIKMIL